MRSATNYLIASSISQTVATIRGDPNNYYVIMDFGAKATKNARILSRMMGDMDNWIYMP